MHCIGQRPRARNRSSRGTLIRRLAEALGNRARVRDGFVAAARIALVTTIGTAVIAAVIGGGGLGELIFRGVASVNTLEILAGAIPAAALALLADAGMSALERRITSR